MLSKGAQLINDIWGSPITPHTFCHNPGVTRHGDKIDVLCIFPDREGLRDDCGARVGEPELGFAGRTVYEIPIGGLQDRQLEEKSSFMNLLLCGFQPSRLSCYFFGPVEFYIADYTLGPFRCCRHAMTYLHAYNIHVHT
jgi:hypothetical protein